MCIIDTSLHSDHFQCANISIMYKTYMCMPDLGGTGFQAMIIVLVFNLFFSVSMQVYIFKKMLSSRCHEYESETLHVQIFWRVVSDFPKGHFNNVWSWELENLRMYMIFRTSEEVKCWKWRFPECTPVLLLLYHEKKAFLLTLGWVHTGYY